MARRVPPHEALVHLEPAPVRIVGIAPRALVALEAAPFLLVRRIVRPPLGPGRAAPPLVKDVEPVLEVADPQIALAIRRLRDAHQPLPPPRRALVALDLSDQDPVRGVEPLPGALRVAARQETGGEAYEHSRSGGRAVIVGARGCSPLCLEPARRRRNWAAVRASEHWRLRRSYPFRSARTPGRRTC